LPSGLQTTGAAGWRINATALAATNVPGQPEAVTTTPLPEPVSVEKPLSLPAHSITVLSFAIAK
jgi:hypothetical protein